MTWLIPKRYSIYSVTTQLLLSEGEKMTYRSTRPPENSLAFPPPLYGTLGSRNVTRPCQYILAREIAKKCLVFSRKYSCNLEMILLWIFWEINQSPVKTHSVHFYPNCVFGLVFLSLRISYRIPGLFKNMSPLGHTELLSTQCHVGTS